MRSKIYERIMIGKASIAGSAKPALIGLALAIVSAFPSSAQQTQPVLPLPSPVASTVPANGDLNPYGVVFVPHHVTAGLTLQPDDVLVSNFNNNQNLQGTGTSIVRVGSNGRPSLFYQSPYPATGLTAALGVVLRGFVFVGSTPTADGTSATVQPGSLLILDGSGNLLGSVANNTLIAGPWGMAIMDTGTGAHIFVSNILNGTITRIDVSFPNNGSGVVVNKVVQVGSGFSHRTDPAALVLGPSGLRYDAAHDTLYIASSTDNAIYALKGVRAAKASVGSGQLVYQDFVHLHGPTQLALAPNGNLLVADSDGSNVDPNQPSEIVEFTTAGQFVTQFSIDQNNGGAFGVAVDSLGSEAFRIATVDDDTNTVTTWTELVR
jgi:hypothetical protein